ncbi:MAG: hypothetical protein LBQ66_05165 [Planctomycetaceae bacterium]|nr:hypothetical protein [Planctomycetaceae bacterium]
MRHFTDILQKIEHYKNPHPLSAQRRPTIQRTVAYLTLSVRLPHLWGRGQASPLQYRYISFLDNRNIGVTQAPLSAGGHSTLRRYLITPLLDCAVT